MKDFDNSFLTLINADEAAVFWLIDMQTDSVNHLYYTSLDIDLVYDGNRYLTTAFEITPVSYTLSMAVDKLRVEFANVDLSMSAILLNNTVTGQPFIIYAGAMDGLTPVVEPVFTGLTSEWTLDENSADFTVVDEFVWWNKRSLRKPEALCPWAFKSTECGYTGSASSTCNKTFAKCASLANTANFGGFRFFPAIEEKEVWWGRSS